MDGAGVREAQHDQSVWLLTGAFGAEAAAVGILLVAALGETRHAVTGAAARSGLLGVMSVTGRLITTRTARRIGITTVTAGFGVATTARPAFVADRYGTARYATIAASMAMPITLARAFAPLGAAALTSNAFLTTAGVMCLASAGVLWSTRTRRSSAGYRTAIRVRSASS